MKRSLLVAVAAVVALVIGVPVTFAVVAAHHHDAGSRQRAAGSLAAAQTAPPVTRDGAFFAASPVPTGQTGQTGSVSQTGSSPVHASAPATASSHPTPSAAATPAVPVSRPPSGAPLLPFPSPTPAVSLLPSPSVSVPAADGCTVGGVVAPCVNGPAGAGASGWGAPAFDDEFSGTSLNTADWIPGRREGGGSVCTSACQPYNPGLEQELLDSSAVSVSGGSLVITAQQKSLDGGVHPWTSGTVEMRTRDFTYGFFEARIRVPSPAQAWTSFWLTSATSWPPEVDVFEFDLCTSGPNAGHPAFNNHGTVSDGLGVELPDGSCGEAYGPPGTDFTQWHTYGLAWTATSLQVYFDGVLQSVATTSTSPMDAVPSTPMYPIFSYLIADGANPPDGSQLDVDYLRVWQH